MSTKLNAEPYPLRTEIVARGTLGPALLAALDGYEVRSDGGFTRITGRLVDQAELLGLIEFCAGFNMQIVSVNPVVPAGEAAAD